MIKIAKKVTIVGGRAFLKGGKAVGFRSGETRRARLRRTSSGGFEVVVESTERAAEIKKQLEIERTRLQKEQARQRELESQRKQLRQEKLETKAKIVVGSKGTTRIITPSGIFAGQRARGKFVTVAGKDLTIGRERVKAKEGEIVGVTIVKPKPPRAEQLDEVQEIPMEQKPPLEKRSQRFSEAEK